MGRLINTEDLHNVVMKRKTAYGKLATLVDNTVEEIRDYKRGIIVIANTNQL